MNTKRSKKGFFTEKNHGTKKFEVRPGTKLRYFILPNKSYVQLCFLYFR